MIDKEEIIKKILNTTITSIVRPPTEKEWEEAARETRREWAEMRKR